MKVLVYSTHKFERNYLVDAMAHHSLQLLDTRLTKETAVLAEGFDAVSLFVSDDASAPVLRILKECGVQYIALRSAGFNHVDLEEAERLDMKVARVPEYSPAAIAEHTVALMLTLNRKIIRAHSRVREMNFSLDGLTGFDMKGKTVGVIGTGSIGSVTAKILHGFGCRILAFDREPRRRLIDKFEVTYCDLETLVRESDIITLHVPLSPATRYMIDAARIAMMKDGVMLINTSRGGLLKTKDVINALKSGKIGFLGLDVYEEEEGLFFEDHSGRILQDDIIARLMTFPNVLITSHQAFLTHEALMEIAATTAYNIDCWEKSGAPANLVIA